MKVPAICADISSPGGFYEEVKDRISREERLLEKVSGARRGYWIGHIVAFAMLVTIVAIMLYRPNVALIWFIASFLLFSFNYLILLFPTTRKEGNVDKCHRTFPGRVILPILREKKKLAIEVGITMFLGGMVPLALSFFIIFGVGLFFAVSYGLIGGLFDQQIAFVIVVQTTVIIIFFIMMIFLHPQSQGITRIAIDLKRRIGEARSRGRLAGIIVMAAIAMFAAIVGTVSAWAILATGSTLGAVIDLGGEMGVSILLLSLVLGGEIVVMRQFQAVSSRRMARNLLHDRVNILKAKVLAPLEALVAGPASPDLRHLDKVELDRIKTAYFSIVVYEVIELNFFGFSPVYFVGPDIRYLLDERTLPYVTVVDEKATS